MYTIDAMWEMNAAHHKELLQAAEVHRSSARIYELSLQPMARVLQLTGDVLIVIGLRLKARFTPRVHKVA